MLRIHLSLLCRRFCLLSSSFAFTTTPSGIAPTKTSKAWSVALGSRRVPDREPPYDA